MGLNYREISQNLTVSLSTVARMVDRFERTGEVTRSVKPATEHILHEHDVFVLMQIVLERPSVYLHEPYVTIGLTDFVQQMVFSYVELELH